MTTPGDAPGEEDVARLAREVVTTLTARGLTLATAESLTGGLLAARVVDVPGASAVLRGGVVAYATDLKHLLLGVDADLLAARGAVDPDVAAAMALGVRERLGADVGVATTGVAGPDPQDGHAAGTVFVAVSLSPALAAGGAGGGRVVPLLLAGDRTAIRTATVAEALGLVLASVTG
ncbi:CinA family protein [Kineosporia sp. A_224]|uniref:CinA family protein n=1 Tax=Kineosporia sp. A_224 TaxID=1962180 RepID=UPI000B4A740B|nr:CinA family protein [Kineosporia sp. A_224]